MFHHIAFVVTTTSLFIAALCQMREELLKADETNHLARLASSRHFVPEPVLASATVNSITFPAFDHLYRPCPSSADTYAHMVILSSADFEHEERLHSEQHAHRSKSKEALLREREETRVRKMAKQRSNLIVAAAMRRALMKMKYETNALIVYLPSPYPRFPKPVETTVQIDVISNKTDSWSYVDFLPSVSFPSRNRMARHFESSVAYINTTFGIDLHTGAASVAASCKSASFSPSVATIRRHSQTVARVASRLTTVRTATGAFAAIFLLVCTCFGIRRWRSKARIVSSLPSSPSVDDSPSCDDSPSFDDSPSPDNSSSPESPLPSPKLGLKPLTLSSRARPANRTTAPLPDTRTNRHKTPRPGQSLKSAALASPVGGLVRPERLSLPQLTRMAKANVISPDGALGRPLSHLASYPPSSPTRSENGSSDTASSVNSPTLSRELSLLASYLVN